MIPDPGGRFSVGSVKDQEMIKAGNCPAVVRVSETLAKRAKQKKKGIDRIDEQIWGTDSSSSCVPTGGLGVDARRGTV